MKVLLITWITVAILGIIINLGYKKYSLTKKYKAKGWSTHDVLDDGEEIGLLIGVWLSWPLSGLILGVGYLGTKAINLVAKAFEAFDRTL